MITGFSRAGWQRSTGSSGAAEGECYKGEVRGYAEEA